MALRHPLFVLLTSASLLTLHSGCDAQSEQGTEKARHVITVAGIRHVASGPSASLVPGSRGLRLDAPTGGHLTVETDEASQADLHFDLSGLSDGDVFTSELVDRTGRPFARLSQLQRGGAYETSAAWSSASRATLEALNEGHVVYAELLNETGASAGSPLGTTSDSATSVHYSEKGHIVYDFEGTDSGPDGGTTYAPPGAAEMSYRITHLRVMLAEGWPANVAGILFTTPAGADLMLTQEHVGVFRPGIANR